MGGGIPISTGAAYASKMRGRDNVTVCFFGDSATNEGTFHESVNMAAAWDLPVVYIIENNLYGISVDIRSVTKEHQLSKRAVGYGIPGLTIDGNDVFTVYDTVNEAVERARKGQGPTLIECLTYRWQGHHVGDPAVYRPEREVADWRGKEPIGRLEALKLLDAGDIEAIKAEWKRKSLPPARSPRKALTLTWPKRTLTYSSIEYPAKRGNSHA